MLFFYTLLDILYIYLIFYNSASLFNITDIEEPTCIIKFLFRINFRCRYNNFINFNTIIKEWFNNFSDLSLQIFLIKILLFNFFYLIIRYIIKLCSFKFENHFRKILCNYCFRNTDCILEDLGKISFLTYVCCIIDIFVVDKCETFVTT